MIGTDIIEIERIRDSIKKHSNHFLDRIFTKNEQTYCNRLKDPAPCYAGRFAAKEAIAKALGTGFGKSLSWLDIEILPNNEGKPIATLRCKKNVTISISHCKSYAVAMALTEVKYPPTQEQ